MKTLIASLLLSSLAFAETIESVRAKLDQSVYACPERLWPGLNWKDKSIILVDSTSQRAVLLQGNNAENLPASVAQNMRGHFDFGEWQGKPALYVDVSEDEAFELVVHEGFHMFNQSSLLYNTEGRDSMIPMNPEPRIQRESLGNELANYLLSSDETALKRAKAWHELHRSSREPLGIDVIEGSAKYVESLATTLAAEGCGVSEEQLISSTAQALSDWPTGLDQGSQAYKVGSLAFLVASKMNLSIISSLNGRNQLVDLVLQNVSSAASVSADPGLRVTARAQINFLNEHAMSAIRPVQEALKSGSPFVFVKISSLQGSYSAQGMFSYSDGSYLVNLEVSTNEGTFSGHAKEVNACGEEGFLILAPAVPGGTPSTFGNSPITCY